MSNEKIPLQCLHQKSTVADDVVEFLINNIETIYAFPLERQIRALRTLADVPSTCSIAFPPEVLDKLFEEFMVSSVSTNGAMNPSLLQALTLTLDQSDSDEPDIDFFKLEIVMLAIYRLKHTAALVDKIKTMLEDTNKMHFRKK